MNAAWRPCFHADVVRALAGAKLDWVASAQLLENFTPLMLSEEARGVLSGFDDPVMRELVKDMFLTRCLRQDVFVRGARRLTDAERDASLGEVTLALLAEEDQFAWEFDVPVGQANIERKFFGPIVAALADAPRRVGALLGLPDLPRRDNPGEVVGMLVGSHQALPVIGPATEPDDSVRRLNRAAARRLVRPDNIDTGMALAATGTGSPVPCTMLDLFHRRSVTERLAHRTPPPGRASLAPRSRRANRTGCAVSSSASSPNAHRRGGGSADCQSGRRGGVIPSTRRVL